MLTRFCFLSFFSLPGLSQTCWRRARARRTRARTPHTCPVTPSTARSILTALATRTCSIM
eukprot:5317345-Prymnesium_polylepis.1